MEERLEGRGDFLPGELICSSGVDFFSGEMDVCSGDFGRTSF